MPWGRKSQHHKDPTFVGRQGSGISTASKTVHWFEAIQIKYMYVEIKFADAAHWDFCTSQSRGSWFFFFTLDHGGTENKKSTFFPRSRTHTRSTSVTPRVTNTHTRVGDNLVSLTQTHTHTHYPCIIRQKSPYLSPIIQDLPVFKNACSSHCMYATKLGTTSHLSPTHFIIYMYCILMS